MRKNKKNIENLSQIHGKLEDKEYKTLDQIWGDDGSSKYKTLDESEYKIYLSDLNKSDLQNHAAKLGLIPIDDRDSLTRRLISEFRKYVSLYKIPKTNSNKINLNKQAKNILSEGR
jgi:hypothetical protein